MATTAFTQRWALQDWSGTQQMTRCLLVPLQPPPPPLREPATAGAPQENKLGQKFVVDATLEADLMVAGQTDDLARTVNYAQVYE